MKNFKHFLLLFITLALVISCSDDDDATSTPPPPPSSVEANVTFSMDNPAMVSVTPTATAATSFEVLFGDVANEVPTVLSPGATATNIYEEGSFTISVTAIGLDNQQTTVTEDVVISLGDEPFDGGLLINGDFEAGAEPWNAGVEEFDADPAPVVTENGNTFYSVSVDSPDANQPFLVNLSQQGLTVVEGTNYILTFDAWSDTNRAIIAGIGESSGSFNSVPVDVNLTTEMQTITLNLTADGFGGDDIRVLFDSNGEAGSVNIDNVSLFEGGDGSDTPGNDGGTSTEILINGDFEAGAEPWNAGVEEFDAAPAPVVTENGNTFYSVNVENPDPGQPFLVNLSQQGLTLVAGTNYILSFDAWSDQDRSIIAGIGESSGGFASVPVNVDLTASMQRFMLNLTADGFGGDDIRVFFDSNGEAGMVNIDNVSLVEGGDGSDTPGDDGGDDMMGGTDTIMLINGDFEAGAEPWTVGLGPDAAPIVTENGNTFYSVNVDTATPDQVFLVNLSQIGLTIVPDTNYILTFDAWSNVNRSIVAGIGLSGGDFANSSVPVDITTTVETYTLQLTSVGFGDNNSRVLFDLAGEVGMVNIDNVTIVEGGDGSDTP